MGVVGEYMAHSIKNYLFLALSIFLLNCGSTPSTPADDTNQDQNESPDEDGSSFMSLSQLNSTDALITVDLGAPEVSDYLDGCLYINVSGMDEQDAGQNVSSAASYYIWDTDMFGEVALDSDNAGYDADENDDIAEIIVGSGIFSFDHAITVGLVSKDCNSTGAGSTIFEIEKSLN